MSRKILNGLDLTGQKIVNLGDGSAPSDAVTLQQLQAFVRGLSWKTAARAASTGNVSLTAPGATMDGVSLAAGDRVLLKNQTAGAENGLYTWTGAAAALTRTTDADSAAKLVGSSVLVTEGTTNADKQFTQNTDAVTLGTTALVWAQLGGGGVTYTDGAGLTLAGATFNVGQGTGITVGADTVSVDFTVAVRKYAVNVGTGAATSIVVTHNLGTRDVTVAVFDNTTFEEVLPDVFHTDANTVTLVFAVAPAAGAYRAVVHA